MKALRAPVAAAIAFVLVVPGVRASLVEAPSWRVSDSRATGTPPSDGISPGTRRQASRLLLEFRAREVHDRIDSLWGDTLRVLPQERPRFRRALQAARKVLADVEGRISELRSRELENRKWEKTWTRTERALYGLGRFIDHAESMQVLDVGRGPPAPAESHGHEL